MEIISVMNAKGGVGKTSLVANLGYLLATEFDKSVLVIDLDSQANLSSLYIEDNEVEPSVSAVFKNRTYNIEEATSPAMVSGEVVPNLYVAHSNIALAQALREIPLRINREKMLHKALQNLDVDYVLIDCPPAADDAVLNALFAATTVLVPVQMGGFATNAIQDVLDLITEVKGYDDAGEMLENEKVLFVRNKYDSRVRSVNKKVDEALEPIKEYLALTKCRIASGMDHAIMDDRPLAMFDPRSKLVSDFRDLVREIS